MDFQIAAVLIECDLRGMQKAERRIANPGYRLWIKGLNPECFFAERRASLQKWKECLLQMETHDLHEWALFHRQMSELSLRYHLRSPEYKRDEHPALKISEEIWKHVREQNGGLKIYKALQAQKVEQSTASAAA